MYSRSMRNRALFLVAVFLNGIVCQAASLPKNRKSEPQIPTNTTAPPSLVRKAPKSPFECEREFTYKGEVLECDSNVRKDGEGLRPIINSVPAAVRELDLYQGLRSRIGNTAYIGSVGIAILIAGWLISNQLKAPDGTTINDTGKFVSRISFYGGVGITAGAVAYGLSLNRSNEEHLQNAVSLYNQAHPKDPILLQFNTRVSF